jgi:hypothetical protein
MGSTGSTRIMGDHDHSATRGRLVLLQKVQKQLAVGLIETSCGLVRQKQTGLKDHSPCKSNPTLHAATQLTWELARVSRQPNSIQNLGCSPCRLFALVLVGPLFKSRQTHILKNRQCGQQVKELKDEAKRRESQSITLGQRKCKEIFGV